MFAHVKFLFVCVHNNKTDYIHLLIYCQKLRKYKAFKLLGRYSSHSKSISFTAWLQSIELILFVILLHESVKFY
jgi:hypothetical protein